MRGDLTTDGQDRTDVPKQNRPLVRDGRLQARKKRTDRSYLRPAAPTAPGPQSDIDADVIEDPAALAAAEEVAAAEPDIALLDDGPEAIPPVRSLAGSRPRGAVAPPASAPSPASAAPRSGRLPTTVRAIQQQGVRKRRDIDLAALAKRDTDYAIHELRRIAVLAATVVVTLIVLGVFLR